MEWHCHRVGKFLPASSRYRDDQVAFFANAALNTVEKAAAVFLKGCHTFRFTCTQNDPDQYVRDGTLVADFGSFECVLNLMNQMSKPLSINLGTHRYPLPGTVGALTDYSEDALRSILEVGKALESCEEARDSDGMKHCLAWHIAHARPMIDFLPIKLHSGLRKIAEFSTGAIESILEVGKAMEGCVEDRDSDGMKKCLAYHIAKTRPMIEFLPVDLRPVVQTLGKFPSEAIDSILEVGRAMTGCAEDRDSDAMKKCLAYHIAQARPMIEFLPVDLRGVVQTLGKFPSEAIDSILEVGRAMTGCAEDRDSDGMKKCCLAYQITQAAPSIEFLPKDLRGPLQMLSSNPLALMPGPLQTMATVGETLNHCTDKTSHDQLLECFGFRMLEHTSPLKYLLRLKEVMGRYVEVFVQIGNKMMERAMEENPTLLQTAVRSNFGALGDSPIVHHTSSTPKVKTHVQSSEFLQQKAQPRHERGDDKWTEFGWQIGDYGRQTASLIQFNGREKSTGSCLAFAPRTKTGTNQQATEADWQVENEDDFLKLEPYAVPCSNAWMQQNWNKWQEYSFYTWPTQVEKCIAVNFNIAIQPVLALIGGIQFKVLPDPLAQLSACCARRAAVQRDAFQPNAAPGQALRRRHGLREREHQWRFPDLAQRLRCWLRQWGGDPRYKALRSQFGPPEGESSTGIDSMARSAFQDNQSRGERVTQSPWFGRRIPMTSTSRPSTSTEAPTRPSAGA